MRKQISEFNVICFDVVQASIVSVKEEISTEVRRQSVITVQDAITVDDKKVSSRRTSLAVSNSIQLCCSVLTLTIKCVNFLFHHKVEDSKSESRRSSLAVSNSMQLCCFDEG